MSQVKLDPAYKRHMQAPRVGGLAPPKPPPQQRSWLKGAFLVLACLLMGAGAVWAWPMLSSWLRLAG